MRKGGFSAKLAAVQANSAMHDTWRLLADYPASGTARVAATRLRRRYPPPAWRFRTRRDPHGSGRYRLAVFYAQLPKEGQVQ
jgi:hypothetical protein